MKKTLFVGFLIFALGAVTGGTIVHFAMKGYDPRTVKVAVGTEAVAALEEAEASKLPTEFTVGNRTYELLSYVRAGETAVTGHTMLVRTKELGADLGQEDAEHILKHQNEIPAELRGKIILVFTDWRNPDFPGFVAYLDCYDDGRWILHWFSSGRDWRSRGRVVRRKS